MTDNGVAAREDPTLMAVVGPAHLIRRTSVLTNFEDLGIAIEITDVMTSNDQSIALLSVHRNLQISSSACAARRPVPRDLSPLCA